MTINMDDISITDTTESGMNAVWLSSAFFLSDINNENCADAMHHLHKLAEEDGYASSLEDYSAWEYFYDFSAEELIDCIEAHAANIKACYWSGEKSHIKNKPIYLACAVCFSNVTEENYETIFEHLAECSEHDEDVDWDSALPWHPFESMSSSELFNTVESYAEFVAARTGDYKLDSDNEKDESDAHQISTPKM